MVKSGNAVDTLFEYLWKQSTKIGWPQQTVSVKGYAHPYIQVYPKKEPP